MTVQNIINIPEKLYNNLSAIEPFPDLSGLFTKVAENPWTSSLAAAVSATLYLSREYINNPANFLKAAEEGSTWKIRLFARLNPDIGTASLALSRAASRGHIGAVKALIEIVNGIDVNAWDNHGMTALIWAAEQGHTEMVRLLLDTDGIEVNTQDNRGLRSGKTALLRAAHHGRTEIVRLLLDTDDIEVHTRDKFGETALMLAARGGHAETVQTLLAVDGTDANIQDDLGGTALMEAAGRTGNGETVKVLLKAKGIDVNLQDNKKRTALTTAVWNEKTETIQVLLTAEGINLNLKDEDGYAAFEAAAFLQSTAGNHMEILLNLLTFKSIKEANLNKKEKENFNKLLFNIKRCPKKVQLFLCLSLNDLMATPINPNEGDHPINEFLSGKTVGSYFHLPSLLLLHILKNDNINESTYDKMMKFISTSKVGKNKLFKDGKKQKSLLTCLLKLYKCDFEKSKDKIFDLICQTTETKIMPVLDILSTLIDINRGRDLSEISNSVLDRLAIHIESKKFKKGDKHELFFEKLESRINDFINDTLLTDIKDSSKIYPLFKESFGQFRDPYAIIRYTNKHKDSPDRHNCLKQLTSSILNSDPIEQTPFKKLRYDLSSSEHLKKIDEKLLGEWKNGSSAPMKTEPLPKKELDKTYDFHTWLKDKSDHNHLDKFPLLKRGSLDNSVEMKLISKEDEFQKQVLDLYGTKGPIDKKALSGNLKKLLAFTKEGLDLGEFENDIQDLLKLLSPKKPFDYTRYTIHDTDDFNDLLLCGTEILGSCQRVDGAPSLNKGLLGYLRNGKNRLIAIKGPDGKLMARSLFRLLLNEKNEPVLFMERIYSNSPDPVIKKALISLAKQRAKQLGLPLLSKEIGEGKAYETPIKSLADASPYEYVDATGGIKTSEGFTINEAHYVE